MGSPSGRVIYTSPDGAGQVLQHYSKEPEEHDNNLAAARILADRKGYRVELVAAGNTQGLKSADALIEGRKWEIKTSREHTYTSVSNLLRKAKRQAPNVILHITGNVLEEVWRKAVFDRFSFEHPGSTSFQLQNIIIITKEYRIHGYSRENILRWCKKGRFE